MTNEQVLKSFWCPNGYFRTTSTGLSAATIAREIDGCPCSVDPATRYQPEVERVLSAANDIYVKPKTKYITSWVSMQDGFVQIVNDALTEIYAGRRGMVFTREQAVKVCSFLTRPKIEIVDGNYYISIKSNA